MQNDEKPDNPIMPRTAPSREINPPPPDRPEGEDETEAADAHADAALVGAIATKADDLAKALAEDPVALKREIDRLAHELAAETRRRRYLTGPFSAGLKWMMKDPFAGNFTPMVVAMAMHPQQGPVPVAQREIDPRDPDRAIRDAIDEAIATTSPIAVAPGTRVPPSLTKLN